MNDLHSWKILDKDHLVNIIVSSESFVSLYCKNNGYSYVRYTEDILNDENKKIVTSDIINLYIQAENKFLKAQLQAQTERSDFIEDCIAEMAGVVYNTEETTT